LSIRHTERLAEAGREPSAGSVGDRGDNAFAETIDGLYKPFPNHLPREHVVIEAPTTCGCWGSDRIVKMGKDIPETREVIPRQWTVIQTVREKFTCRTCEKISQPCLICRYRACMNCCHGTGRPQLN